jgi:hypothetical protein
MNTLVTDKHYLLILDTDSDDVKYLRENFCGRVGHELTELTEFTDDTILYVCGNITKLRKDLCPRNTYIVRELSYGYEDTDFVPI